MERGVPAQSGFSPPDSVRAIKKWRTFVSAQRRRRHFTGGVAAPHRENREYKARSKCLGSTERVAGVLAKGRYGLVGVSCRSVDPRHA